MISRRRPGRIILSVCILLGLSGAHAQESRIMTQSARCAAIFTVLAEASAEDKGRQQKFLKAESIFSELFVKEGKSAAGKPSLEEAHRRRDLVLQEFRDTYTSRRAYLIEESVLCGAWGEGFLVQGENYGYVPVIPKVISETVRTDYETAAKVAFARWMR